MDKDKDLDKELEKNLEQTNEADTETAAKDSAENLIEEDIPAVDAAALNEPEENLPKKELVQVEDSADEQTDGQNDTPGMITVRPIKFQRFEMTEPNRSIKRNLDIMQDVSMHISVELGKAKSTIKEVMDMDVGSIVELDKIAGEQVEVYVNNKLVAKGEVIVIEDKFGVRVTSTSLPKAIQ